MRLAVQPNRAADNAGICAEVLRPGAIAEDDHVIASGRVFVGAERAAVECSDSECLEEAGRDPCARKRLRLGSARIRKAVRLRPGDDLERPRPFLPIDHVRRRDRIDGCTTETGGLEQQDDSVRVTIRELPNEESVDHAEDRGCGTNPECQHGNRQQCESWIPPQEACAVLQVVNEIGITRELPAKPGGIAKRSKDASKQVDLLSPGQSGASGQPGSSGVEL